MRRSGMNHNVLLIEDDPAVVRMIQEALADASDGPFIVECGRRLSEGLDRLNEGGIAAVLLDLFLPDSQGVNTFGRLGAQLCDI
jgi:DNA-binding response OmpR family regulator